MLARGLGVPLFGHLILAAAGGAVLFALYYRLPLGAHKEATALIEAHERGFAHALERFDFTRARFHASQLEYLQPDDPVDRSALTAKIELLRDLFERPTVLATAAGVTQVQQRLGELERAFKPRQDPDLLVIAAMLTWQIGTRRDDELHAASLCARAIRLRPMPGGFALAQLARAYLETFVDAPYQPEAAELGRDSYPLEDLQVILAYAPTSDAAQPLAARIRILRLMRTVDAQSSTAYAETIQWHAQVVVASERAATMKTKVNATKQERDAAAAEVKDAITRRTEAAGRVLAAWKAFDEALLAEPELARDPAIVNVFRLNDALYSRAKWFVDPDRKDSLALAPLLAAQTGPKKLGDDTNLRLAPPRIVWARRYHLLIEGPARQLFELQEANRFAVMEAAAQAFEQAMIAKERGPETVPHKLHQVAAEAAAALGLYVLDKDVRSPRKPFALEILPGGKAALDEALRGRGIRLL